MEQQISFAPAEYADKKKVTRRERFLGEMERVVPWDRLVALIEPHSPLGQRGRPLAISAPVCGWSDGRRAIVFRRRARARS